MKINRFPKMMILWGVYFHDIEGLDDYTSAALGHYVATALAVLKNRGWSSRKKKSNKFTNGNKNSVDMREGWELFEHSAIPLGKVWIKKTTDGVVYKFGGKEVNGTAKYIEQIERKFKDRKFYNDYVNYAKEIVKQIGSDWKRKWFKTWKAIRDLDWSQSMPIGNLQSDKQISLSA